VVNSGRQIGGVFGTAILVLILGKAAKTGDPTQYYHLWWVAVAACAAAAVTSLGLTPRRQTEEETGAVVRSLTTAPERWGRPWPAACPRRLATGRPARQTPGACTTTTSSDEATAASSSSRVTTQNAFTPAATTGA
jgi:hypothetical protein